MRRDNIIRAAIVGPDGVQAMEGMFEDDGEPPEAADLGPAPEFGPDGEAKLGEWPRSLPIWLWGLLKADPRSVEELTIELHCSRESVYNTIYRLRRRGHNIHYAHRHYHLLDGPPLRISWGHTGFRLATLSPPHHIEVTEIS